MSAPRTPAHRLAAIVLLLSVAAVWLWAHEGHEPLPVRGVAVVKDARGTVTGIVLSRAAREALGLQTAEVQERALAGRLLAPAALVSPWNQHGYAAARLPGRIVKLHVRAGQVVKAGQTLAEVSSLDLESLQLELLNAHNAADLSARLVARLEPGVRDGSVPEQNLLDARTRHQQNLDAEEVGRGKWLGLRLPDAELKRLFESGKPLTLTLPIVSPIAGNVIHADLTVGKVVEPAEHLFEIVDLSSVWVKVGILERDLHQIANGQLMELSLAAYPDETFRVPLDMRSLSLDPQTHLNTAWATFVNPQSSARFLPGQSGQAELLLPGPEKVRAVPEGALIHDGVEHYVLVEQSRTVEESELVRVRVAVGKRTDGWAEVLAGDVHPGSFVATRGSHELAGFFVPEVLRLSAEGERDIGLKTDEVREQVVEDVLEVEGAVEVPPDRRAAVSTPLAGSLQQILVGRNDQVAAGQEIARIASIEMLDLQLDLLRSHLETRRLQDAYERLKTAGRSVPQRLAWETESKLLAARNQRDTLKRKLQSLGLTPKQVEGIVEQKQLVEYLPVLSPIAGRVVRFDKALGQALKPGDTLFEIHDLERPLIQAFLSESDAGSLRIGQKARVRLTADPAFVGVGTVVRSSGVLAPESRTLSAWIRLDQQPERPLLHGQLARITLVRAARPPSVAVPLSAVVREGSQSFVFVKQPNGIFDRRVVVTGQADDRAVEIRSGLGKGNHIVISGASALQTAHASIR